MFTPMKAMLGSGSSANHLEAWDAFDYVNNDNDHTYNSGYIGDPHPDRWVVVALYLKYFGASSGPDVFQINGVNAGVSSTLNGAHFYMFWLQVPLGTSCTIRIASPTFWSAFYTQIFTVRGDSFVVQDKHEGGSNIFVSKDNYNSLIVEPRMTILTISMTSQVPIWLRPEQTMEYLGTVDDPPVQLPIFGYMTCFADDPEAIIKYEYQPPTVVNINANYFAIAASHG